MDGEGLSSEGVAIAVGLVLLTVGILDLLSGRTAQGYRRTWNLPRDAFLTREDNPILFGVYVTLQLGIGATLVGYGALGLLR